MANQKISQMPAAASLTGSELIELVQGGVNVQSTITALGAAVASPYVIQGNPNGQVSASFSNQLIWSALFPSSTGSPSGSSNVNSSAGWSAINGSPTLQSLNGGGSNLGSSVQLGIITSSAIANSAVDLSNSSYNIGNPSSIALARTLTSGFLVGGFTMTLYFVFTTSIALEQVFMGFSAGPNGGYGGSQTPSALLNMIGLGKDAGDTSLQFMINNGSGTAQKTSLGAGVTPVSLNGHLLRLVITCDGAGNCAMTLSDLESGGLTYSITYPTATAKLPAAWNSTGGQLNPHLHLNNGGVASAVAFGYLSCFITAGFGSC